MLGSSFPSMLGESIWLLQAIVINGQGICLKCYYDQKYEFFVLSIFRKHKYILLTLQSFKSKFVREVQLF